MHQRKSKKILTYFLLLMLIGSINNIGLNKIKFSNISNIEILGLEEQNSNLLLKSINNLKLGNIFFINKKEIQKIIESDSLVEKYDIFKIYPSSLYINIERTKFLARISYNSINYIIGSNGKLSRTEPYRKKLPFIFGKPKVEEFLRFKEIIDMSKFDYKDIKNLYYFANERWDLELTNKIMIKLPKKNFENSLELAFQFLNSDEFNQIKIIDLRVNNQIILND